MSVVVVELVEDAYMMTTRKQLNLCKIPNVVKYYKTKVFSVNVDRSESCLVSMESNLIQFTANRYLLNVYWAG